MWLPSLCYSPILMFLVSMVITVTSSVPPPAAWTLWSSCLMAAENRTWLTLHQTSTSCSTSALRDKLTKTSQTEPQRTWWKVNKEKCHIKMFITPQKPLKYYWVFVQVLRRTQKMKLLKSLRCLSHHVMSECCPIREKTLLQCLRRPGLIWKHLVCDTLAVLGSN